MQREGRMIGPDYPYGWDFPLPPIPPGVYGYDPLHGGHPDRPKWYMLRDWQTSPESVDPMKPYHYGYLSTDGNKNMHAYMMGTKPWPILGNYHLYVCKLCGRLFSKRKPPYWMRRPDCGCGTDKYSQMAKAQKSRLEGQQFGYLVALDYEAKEIGQGYGGWRCMCVGADGNCGRFVTVPTIRLRQLRVLGCEKCVPEDWDIQPKPGRKPQFSKHGKALQFHRERLQAEVEAERKRRTA